ncbi:MAG: hypothetical protein NDI63_05355 [Pseudobdellovibrio sp.]|nr:hypothetical protein [Pseudobdellovibrio sp.]
MGQAFFVFLIGVFSALTVQASDCADLVGTCYYYKCIERSEACGKKGYYLEFGEHYCEKYQADQDNYTARGQEFLNHIRSCLQDELERENIRLGHLPVCDKVKKFAVDTHKTCYQEYDFCSLPDADKRRIKLTAKKELFDWQMLKFAFWLEKSCFGD